MEVSASARPLCSHDRASPTTASCAHRHAVRLPAIIAARRPTSPCTNGFSKRQAFSKRHLQLLSSIPQVRCVRCTAAAAGGASDGTSSSGDPRQPVDPPEHFDLEATKAMVETAMLAAVAGLGYILATTVKLENSLGYFLPLPVVIAAMRSGKAAGLKTAMATFCLLLVVMGPLRAVAYLLLHGSTASTLGALWHGRVGWLISVPAAAVMRMLGQAAYLLLTSFTMNENIFMAILANVHAFLDQASASMGMSGAPSTLTVASMIFAMLLVNSLCYVFLLHVIYRMVLQSMGFQLGPLPQMVQRYLFAGAIPAQQRAGGT